MVLDTALQNSINAADAVAFTPYLRSWVRPARG